MRWTQNLAPIVSDNIRYMRQTRGLTQRQLADQAGLHTNTIGLIERNAANTSLDTLVRLALALDTTLDQLMEKPHVCYRRPACPTAAGATAR